METASGIQQLQLLKQQLGDALDENVLSIEAKLVLDKKIKSDQFTLWIRWKQDHEEQESVDTDDGLIYTLMYNEMLKEKYQKKKTKRRKTKKRKTKRRNTKRRNTKRRNIKQR